MKYNSSDGWFLIDWSDASTAPTMAAEHLSADGHSPRVKMNNHGPEVDIWGVAHFMIELTRHCTIKDEAGVVQLARRWKEDITVTAETALQEVEVGRHSLLMCCIHALCFPGSP